MECFHWKPTQQIHWQLMPEKTSHNHPSPSIPARQLKILAHNCPLSQSPLLMLEPADNVAKNGQLLSKILIFAQKLHIILPHLLLSPQLSPQWPSDAISSSLTMEPNYYAIVA